MSEEIPHGSFWDLKSRTSLGNSCNALNLVWVALCLSFQVRLGVLACLFDVTGDIKSVTRSLRNSETIVESNATWDGTKTNYNSPHLVNSKLADASASSGGRTGDKRFFEASGYNQCNDCSCELAETLHGEHGVHHSSSPLCGSELRGNNGRQWVVTTDSNALLD